MDTWAPSAARGFLPEHDPLRRLPAPFDTWEDAAAGLPKAIAAQRVRALVADLPPFPVAALSNVAELWRARVVLSHIANCYVWADPPPVDRLPAQIAMPWHAVSTTLGMPPMLTYADWTLHKWFRADALGPIAPGNLALTQNCAGGLDEEWFVIIHVAIEAAAGPGLAALLPAQQATRNKDKATLTRCLGAVSSALDVMNGLLDRMRERCDPYVYYHRVRPYMFGWRGNPALPNGLIYEGVAEYGGQPREFFGETGAQSTVIPSFDAALGIAHEPDEMRIYLRAMLDYAPPNHRDFVQRLEHGPDLRAWVLDTGGALSAAYNTCIDALDVFRGKHLQLAADYIFKQNAAAALGTGGTPFMRYLNKHRAETRESRLDA
jgi:indoleamine 2,3-dioxygenase